jgi:hypothetical protein
MFHTMDIELARSKHQERMQQLTLESNRRLSRSMDGESRPVRRRWSTLAR